MRTAARVRAMRLRPGRGRADGTVGVMRLVLLTMSAAPEYAARRSLELFLSGRETWQQ
ncbi:hypothetical protein GCM10010222_68480 [Streptomyces tanashiensis]|nr:hypothetical protein GCM10010222_68480 [Streptomyces tanashiensis]